MDETAKTKKIWGELEKSLLGGLGIDIGCGPDPLNDKVRKFDQEDGDANEISKYVKEQFDFVYSSHCLEHMHNPPAALLEWWKLVRPGGHLFFIVPEEDLYEQGIFPSEFNPDHKATFTISKAKSWSPVSHNVLDLVAALPHAKLVSVKIQDHGYDRRLMRFGYVTPAPVRFATRVYRGLKRRKILSAQWIERWLERFSRVDQTLRPDTLAQIQCIVQKLP